MDDASAPHRLQLALDLVDLEEAMRICRETLDYIDHIEVGTPLIKSVGIGAVRRAKGEFPDRFLVADMKTIDTGAVDAAMAFDAGADCVIVQASAPRQTVGAVVGEARRRGRLCMVDSLGIDDMIKFERIVEPTGADYAIVHTGIDEQREGFRPLDRLKRITRSGRVKRLAVAGGIGPESVGEILRAMPSGIVIVGASITRSGDPRAVAQEMRRQMS